MSDASDGLRRRAARSVGWVIFERWSSRLLTLVVLAILTRVLSPDDFGLISLATSVIAIAQVFVDSGFSKTLIQKESLGPKDASTAFWTSLGIGVLLCLALFFGAPSLGAFFGESKLVPVLQAMSFLFPITALSQTPAALLERELDFRPLSIRQLIGTFCGSLVAVPVALVGGGIWALVIQSLVTSIVAAIVLWGSTSWRPRFEYSVRAFKALASVGFAILGIDLLDAIQANVDKLLIGVLFSPVELGYYFLAQRLGTILIELVTSVLARVSLSTLSRVQGDTARLNRVFRQLTFAAAAVSVITFGLVAVLAPQVVAFVFGPGWSPSVAIIWVLAPGWALGAVMYFDRNALIARSRANAALGLALLQNVVGVALVFAFAPFGVLGIAFSRLARFVVWPVRLVVLRRAAEIEIWLYLLQLIRCVAAAVLPLGAVLALQSTDWASMPNSIWAFALPASLLALGVYGILLWWIAGDENRAQIRGVVGDLLSKRRRR